MHRVRQAPLCLKHLGARLVALRPEMSVAHRGLVRALHLSACPRIHTLSHASPLDAGGRQRIA